VFGSWVGLCVAIWVKFWVWLGYYGLLKEEEDEAINIVFKAATLNITKSQQFSIIFHMIKFILQITFWISMFHTFMHHIQGNWISMFHTFMHHIQGKEDDEQ